MLTLSHQRVLRTLFLPHHRVVDTSVLPVHHRIHDKRGDYRFVRCRRGGSTSVRMVDQSALVSSTRRWIDHVVVAEKLCPFAPPLVASGTLRVVASVAVNEKQAVEQVRNEVNLLLLTDKDEIWSPTNTATVHISAADNVDTTPHPESTLIVFHAPFVHEFRDFVRLSWTLQEEVIVRDGFLNDIQIVLFHPYATHQTYSVHPIVGDDDDSAASDYTIRSPYPTVHLLREVDVMQVVQGNYPNLPDLPRRNQQKLIAQGLSICKTRLEGCYVSNDANPSVFARGEMAT